MRSATDRWFVRRRNAPAAALVALAAVAVLAFGLAGGVAHAEQGDIVINNYADKAGVRPVVFPHWFHRIRFTCKTCHADLGIKFKAGGNDITMLEIIDGRYCGACHNGQVAWSVENCNLCHSGKPGTPTQVHMSTPRPVAAASTAASPPAASTGASAAATPAAAAAGAGK